MHLCIPVTEDKGLDSPVCAHFGSAPLFLMVDTDSSATRAIANRNLHHQHGMCQPLMALQGERVDAMVVGGIGMGALMKLKMAGVRIFMAQHPTVGLTVAALAAGSLQEVSEEHACAHHHGGHDHDHEGHGPHGNLP